MSLGNRVLVFLWGAIFVTFAVKMPSLVDQYHMSRFLLGSVFGLWGILMVAPKLERLRFTVMDGLLFGFYSLNLLSLAWADNFGEAILTAQKYLLLAVLFLLFRSVLEADKRFRKALLPILVACTLLAAGIPLVQILQNLEGEGLAGTGNY